MSRVLISCRQMQARFESFRAAFDRAAVTCDLPTVAQQLDEEDLLPVIDRYDGVIAGDDVFSRRVLERAVRLRIISKWGVGTDGIDLAAARELGIAVTNTPGAFDGEVADVCVGYLVMLARGLHEIDRSVRAGSWSKPEGLSLGGKTLGIIGLGGIGRAFARRALAMEMVVLGTDPVPHACREAERSGVEVVALPALLERADFVSLNCPLTTENHGLLDAGALGRLRTGAFVLNTARGQLIDEDALVASIESGRLAGAALDVFREEPLRPDHPLLRCPGVIVGSHNASNAREAVTRTSERAIENLLDGLGLPSQFAPPS